MGRLLLIGTREVVQRPDGRFEVRCAGCHVNTGGRIYNSKEDAFQAATKNSSRSHSCGMR